MKIYLDEVWLLNALVDYLLLALCGTLTRTPLFRLRLALAGGLGGIYAACSLLPGWTFLGTLLWEAVFGGILCGISFGPSRRLLRQTAVLFLLSGAFAGVTLLLTELVSAQPALIGSRVYYPLSFSALVLTAGGSYAIFRWALGRLRGGNVVPVFLRTGERSVRLAALRDTGNTLRDPISGESVMVISGAVLIRLMPELQLREADLSRPEETLLRIDRSLSPRLIPYRAVGTSTGMLLAFRPDEVEIDGKRERMLIACSPTPLGDGEYEALLGGTV